MDTASQFPKQQPLVVIAGNIGSGKTTLAGRLGEHFGWWIGCESLQDNPYLEDFYQDMSRWSFHIEMCFLGNRYRQQIEASSQIRGAVLERSVYEDRHIFVEAARGQGILSSRDYSCYMNLYNAIVPTLRDPDLFVFVSAPVPVLLERIARRGRPFERDIPVAYLEELQQRYELWLRALPPERVIRVDSSACNYATISPGSPDMIRLFSLISNALKGLA